MINEDTLHIVFYNHNFNCPACIDGCKCSINGGSCMPGLCSILYWIKVLEQMRS